MGDQSSSPATPNYTPVSEGQKKTAKDAAAISSRARQMAEEQYAAAEKTSAKSEGITDKVIAHQLSQMSTNAEWAQYSMDRFQDTFQPVEDAFVEHAMNFNTDAYRDRFMGQAGALTAEAHQAALQQNKDKLAGYGIDPSSGRFAGLDMKAATAAASAIAMAQNEAGLYVDQHGERLLAEAAGMGNKYPGMADTFNDNSTAAGNAANSNRLAFQDTWTASQQPTQQYTALANDANRVRSAALTGQGQVLNDQYKSQVTKYDQDQKSSSGIGTALGTVAGVAAPLMKVAAAPATGGASMLFNDGGHVPDQVSPTEGAAIDDVPALLTSGEYIIPKYAVEHFGVSKFDKMLQAAQKSNGPDRPRRAIEET